MLLWYFFQGYAIIEIESANINRVLFRISKAGIELRHVCRISYTVLQAQISRKNLLRLQDIMRNDGHIKIQEKQGSWKVYSQGKHHFALVAGIVLMMAAVVFLSHCCLRIEIQGNQQISEYDIYHVAVEHGAKLFTLKDKELLEEIEQALWDHFSTLNYVYVSYEGACLKIVVREKYASPEIHETQPCSVYAQKDGIITNITVYSGKAMVKEGDKVKAGDLLIAGGYYIGTQEFSVHASGEVMAQVDYISSVLLQDKYVELLPTGEESHARVMKLGRREIAISGENPFDCCIEHWEKTASVGENSPIYLEVYDVTYQEATEVYSEQKKQAAILEQQEKIYFETALQLSEGAEITAFNTSETTRQNGIRLIFTLSANESIGVAGVINTPEPIDTQT